jgi:hypothetical protein
MDKEKELAKTACHLCQVIGGSQCDIEMSECGYLPELVADLDKAFTKMANDFLKLPDKSKGGK